MDVREQRVQFVVAAIRREKSLTALCEEFGVSRPTGRLWLQRYRQQGIAGIAERSRRPAHSPRLTAPELEEQVVEMRRRYPDWGARKLAVLLEREGVLLTRSTIHRILLRHDLIRGCDRHELAPQRFERASPNELWQMDFKGPTGWDAPAGPLSVIDDHSRYLLVLQQTGSTRGELVREQLQRAFCESGVPDGMLMDHGIPWWSARGPMGTTELAVWLMKQGIGLHWTASGIRRRRARWSASTARWSGPCSGAAGRASSRSSGWTISAGSTIRCGLTKRWGCGRRPRSGGRACEPTIHIRRAGSIRRARMCAGWMPMARSTPLDEPGT
jgi:transposase